MPITNDRTHGAGRTGSRGLPWGSDPATADVTYTDEELAWLKAIDRYRRLSGRPCVNLREAFRLALSLGYQKGA